MYCMLTDIFQGDSGSPVVHRHSDAFTLVGAVSMMADSSCPTTSPFAYSNIVTLLPWIKVNTGTYKSVIN